MAILKSITPEPSILFKSMYVLLLILNIQYNYVIINFQNSSADTKFGNQLKDRKKVMYMTEK